jgi:hypothetical protein
VKDKLLFVIIVLAFVAFVPLVYYLLFERGLSVTPEGTSQPQAPLGLEAKLVEETEELPQIPVALSLTRSEGKVEIRREGGEWKIAEEGMVLGSEDRIRTDPSAFAVLSMPGVFSLDLDAGSEFRVRSLAENIARFLLEEGMVSADVVDNPDHMVEISASTSVAQTHGGSFKMSVNREGLVTLGTTRGAVDVEGAGKVIQVRAGHYTQVKKGKKPADPIKIPAELFLRVRWPKKRELSTRNLLVRGRTSPGARVRVAGSVVRVDSRGRFRKRLTLNEGINRVKVVSYDVGGNRKERSSPRFTVDTRPDGFKIRTSPEMWEKKKKTTPKPEP